MERGKLCVRCTSLASPGGSSPSPFFCQCRRTSGAPSDRTGSSSSGNLATRCTAAYRCISGPTRAHGYAIWLTPCIGGSATTWRPLSSWGSCGASAFGRLPARQSTSNAILSSRVCSAACRSVSSTPSETISPPESDAPGNGSRAWKSQDVQLQEFQMLEAVLRMLCGGCILRQLQLQRLLQQ